MRKPFSVFAALALQAALLSVPLLSVPAVGEVMGQAAPADGLAPLPGDTRPVNYKLVVTLDAPSSRYTASSKLRFEVLKPTQSIVLHARGLVIDSARLATGEVAQIDYDVARQQVAFSFEKALPPGMQELQVTYGGRIGDQVEGLFNVSYPVAAGGERQMFFTHLCCIATARQFMPLWDQPDLKAVFELELVVPAGLDAVSNMPVAKRENLPGGMARVTFQPTPKMSSYLLFFGAGEFDRIAAQVGTTEVGVVTQHGKAEQGRFALTANVETLGYYNEYFGAPYPLPKLDSVTFPGAGQFGAMENWGAIFYFEPYLLMDPVLSTDHDRQKIYIIVAHEVSHQWFGNLVTMRGWDDLWLNEGFASWMATKATNVFHPEWNMWLHAADSREAAMRLDARASTHPIVRKVHTLEQAELAFDDITYEKGSQVIRMIEAYVGEAAFRTAIRAHIKQHAYGNAVTGELWEQLEKAAPLPVTAIARDFTEQDGVPLIDVLSSQCTAGSNETRVLLRQSRFGVDAISKRAREWRVPVTAAVMGKGEVVRQIVRGARPSTITVQGCGPVKINVGESSYFRTRYDAGSFAQLSQSFTNLPAADQLGLLNDTYSLAEGGYVSFESYLQLAQRLSAASDPVVLLQFVRAVATLDHLYEGRPTRASFRAFAHKQLGALLGEVGWTRRDGESANTSILRAALIESLARVEDSAVLIEARRRFRGADQNPELLSVDTRKAIVNAVGAGADAAFFEELTAHAVNSRDTAEKRSYLLAAAHANDPAIARRALEFALTDAVPASLSQLIIAAVAEVHPKLAFDFVTARFDAIAPRLDSFGRIAFVPQIAANGVERELAQRLAQFSKEKFGAAGSETVERAQSTILFRDEVRRERLPQVDAWLRAQAALDSAEEP